MLERNIILKKLNNEEFIVRNAIFEYVCNLHLYNDEKICEAIIKFIEDNYYEISFAGLRVAKLNKKIIECLIKIYINEKNIYIKSSILEILLNHYNLVKNMDFNLKETIEDEKSLMLYKKIEHFEKKDPSQLLQLYKNNIDEYYFSDKETEISKMMRNAIGTALIQTTEGYEKLREYINKLIKEVGMEEFVFKDMPYLVYPLCQYANPKDMYLILNLYFNNLEFIDYADECNYYFSNICNEELINLYIKCIRKMKKINLEDYYYDIAEYLNSDKIDEFLFEELKRNENNNSIKENIIRILAKRFNNKIIPYAIKYIKKDNLNTHFIKKAIAPLLILEKYNDSFSKNIIQDAKKDERDDEIFLDFLNRMQNFILKDKPHIKKYKNIRKIHDEIMCDMIEYIEKEKFELTFDSDDKTKISKTGIININSEFDTNTELGIQALSNILVYKNSKNIKCLAEIFKDKKKYSKQEKIEMLEDMINSEAGLFEIIKTDRENGQVYLKNVLTNKEHCITDIGFSSNINNDMYYIYTRIIQYKDIEFGTGLHIPYRKDDEFINKWIEDNIKEFDKKQELVRFLELYNEYIKNDNKIKVISRNI